MGSSGGTPTGPHSVARIRQEIYGQEATSMLPAEVLRRAILATAPLAGVAEECGGVLRRDGGAEV